MGVVRMAQPNYVKLAELAGSPQAMERSAAYLQRHLKRFLKPNDRVLILFPKMETATCRILEDAVLDCGAVPVWMGEDGRWMTLLRTAFTQKCSCLVGPPLTLLGLSKLAKQLRTPLRVKHVLMAGYPTTAWMVSGVRKNLDCMAWGCFDPGQGAVIAGFTCPQLDGVHIRTEEYTVEIVDDAGLPMTNGEAGRVVLYPNGDPVLRFAVGDRGRLDTGKCLCGDPAPKLVDVGTIAMGNEDLYQLAESLHYWSSILDCRVERTEYGMELELVVFPGEKLPQLPSVARQVVRPFNPEKDVPFAHHNILKKRFL